MKRPSSHPKAVLQAIFVTLLWSSSWVLIRVGLRYSLAFICLLPFFLRRGQARAVRELSPRSWGRLLALGILYYTVTQGTLFVGLELLHAVSVSLLLNLTPVAVAFLGMALLSERLTLPQWSGVLLSVAGTILFYFPLALVPGANLGYVVVIAGMLANALSSVLGRGVNRTGDLSPLSVTVISMGFGAALLLGGGILIQGLPALSPLNWAIIIWLAIANTAVAFTLWNHTLRILTAVESSVINNTMLIQIAILAWLFLGESLSWKEIAGLIVAGLGALLVQLRRARIERTLDPARSPP